jgi:4-hydroxy-3-methylbut-2-en-1-yl diphosphate reductase
VCKWPAIAEWPTSRHDTPSYLIANATDIRPEWSDGVRVVGVAAGALALSQLVEAVLAALAEFGPVTVVKRETTREDIQFTIPLSARQS